MISSLPILFLLILKSAKKAANAGNILCLQTWNSAGRWRHILRFFCNNTLICALITWFGWEELQTVKLRTKPYVQQRRRPILSNLKRSTPQKWFLSLPSNKSQMRSAQVVLQKSSLYSEAKLWTEFPFTEWSLNNNNQNIKTQPNKSKQTSTYPPNNKTHQTQTNQTHTNIATWHWDDFLFSLLPMFSTQTIIRIHMILQHGL